MNCKFFLCGLTLTMVLGGSGTARAEDITYDSASSPASLRDAPDDVDNTTDVSFFPTAASDNNVTVSYTPGLGMINPDYVLGAFSAVEDVTGNSVTITNGTVTNVVYGGFSASNKDAIANTVTMSNGTANGLVGGHSTFGSAIGNTVNINGLTVVTAVYGGTGNAAANNTVNISGGTVGGYVFGGYSDTGSATGNTVNISGGTIGGYVFGALSNSGSATGNTVILSSNATFGSSIELYGGYTYGSGNVFAGNTLIVNNYTGGSTINTVANFQNYEFILTSNVTATNAALSVVSPIDLAGTNVGITQVDPGVGATLVVGDSFLLIDNTINQHSGTIAPANFTQAYFFDYDSSSSQLIATFSHLGASPQAKAYSEGRLAGLTFLTQKNELIMSQALPHIMQFYKHNPNAKWQPFALVQAASQRANTGSSIKVEGASTIMGLAYRPTNSPLTIGAFFEGGWGDYDTHNSFSNAASVKGRGDTEYYGGGALIRYDSLAGFYVQATASLGQTSNDFRSKDIIIGANSAKYDSDSMYYSANVGVGYLLKITEKAELDIYGRYLWTHMESDSVTVVTDPVRFKAVNSHRMQLGTRHSYELFAGFTPYVGVGYDREFASEVKATSYGLSIAAPDIKGHTGIGELGLSFRPVMLSGLSLDFGVQGYVGKREGVSGTFQVKYLF